MAVHPHSPADVHPRSKLSPGASRFYASVYGSAKKGSIGELLRRGCSPEEAEEFFATAFEKVMASVDPIAREFSAPQMVNFIKRAALRVMFDESRRRARHHEVDVSAVPAPVDAAAEGPDELAEEREAVAMGREALQMLSERDRLIFCQRHQMDLSPEEILQLTPGLTLRTYRKIIQRANNRVHAAFDRIEGGARCEEMESSLLRRFVADQCEEPEQLAVEVHLAHCRACQLAHARMRGYLLDVASALAVFATAGASKRSGLLGLPLRLLDTAATGANGLVEATRAVRERIRDLALRIAGAAPGGGGDATVGQALTATSAKVASVCAAGVAAGACVAAGVVPGVGGIGLLESPAHHRAPPAKTRTHHSHLSPARSLITPLAKPETERTAVPGERREAKAHAGAGHADRSSKPTASPPPAESTSTAASSATESGQVTSGEFGAESGQPVSPPASSPQPSSGSSPGSGGGVAPAQGISTGGSGSSEFGL